MSPRPYARPCRAASAQTTCPTAADYGSRVTLRAVLEAAREQVASACSRLAGEGLVVGTAGNVSVRVDDQVVVTPTGGVFGAMTAEDMPVVDMEGRLVDGRLGPTSELALHLALYERMGAGAVVHTHAPFATALSCVVDEVPAVHYSMLMFGGSLRVASYATFGTEELAENVQRALEGRTACLMQNHGAVGYGHDLDYAVEAALLVEWACTVYWRARAVGDPVALTDEQLQDVAAQVARLGYGSTKEAGS
jgi:L-fuculose-phosphate aldolase